MVTTTESAFFGGSDNVVQDCLVRSCMNGMMVSSGLP